LNAGVLNGIFLRNQSLDTDIQLGQADLRRDQSLDRRPPIVAGRLNSGELIIPVMEMLFLPSMIDFLIQATALRERTMNTTQQTR
jgi:hypothetical protein